MYSELCSKSFVSSITLENALYDEICECNQLKCVEQIQRLHNS